MKWRENNNNSNSGLMRKNLKRNFWQRTKWSKSTAIHNLFYKIQIPKGAIIPKDLIINYKKKNDANATKNIIENKKEDIVENLSILDITEQKVENLNLDILEPLFVKEYSQELLNLLLHHTSFYEDMFKDLPDLNPLKEYLYEKNHKQIPKDQEVSIIRFQQLYNKFKVKENNINKLKIKHIIKKKYNVENYIDNLLFAEYINKILWIWDSQTLIINNRVYKLYVSSLQKDMYHGGDIFLEDEAWKTIWIDITLYKSKFSWKKTFEWAYFDDNIIINYTKYREDFEAFIQEYKKYILNEWAFPQWYSKYSSEQVHEFDQRISNIINLENNTISSRDQDINNNAEKDQFSSDHILYS